MYNYNIFSSLSQGKLVTGTSKAWIGGFGEVCPFGLVSDGKAAIASAITDKGGSALATDTFSILAQSIMSIPTSAEFRYVTGTKLIHYTDRVTNNYVHKGFYAGSISINKQSSTESLIGLIAVPVAETRAYNLNALVYDENVLLSNEYSIMAIVRTGDASYIHCEYAQSEINRDSRHYARMGKTSSSSGVNVTSTDSTITVKWDELIGYSVRSSADKYDDEYCRSDVYYIAALSE